MAEINERTLRMRESYLSLWIEGLSVEEIARRFSLSISTVYRQLEAIADDHGVTREELLRYPQKAVRYCSTSSSGRTEPPIDVDAIQRSLNDATEDARELEQEIRELLKGDG